MATISREQCIQFIIEINGNNLITKIFGDNGFEFDEKKMTTKRFRTNKISSINIDDEYYVDSKLKWCIRPYCIGTDEIDFVYLTCWYLKFIKSCVVVKKNRYTLKVRDYICNYIGNKFQYTIEEDGYLYLFYTIHIDEEIEKTLIPRCEINCLK
jgi:hypothetical protein